MTTTLYVPAPITSITSNGYTITQAGTAVPDNLVSAIISAAYQADGVVVTTSAGGTTLVQVPSYYNPGTGAPSSDSLPFGAEVKDSTGAVFEKKSDGTWVSASGGGGGAVASVAGKTGTVTLVKGDVGLGNVDNTADASKPVSTAQAAAIALLPADLTDRFNDTTETVPAGATTNCVVAGVTKTAPALAGSVGTPPLRWAVRNSSTGNITVSYPSTTGTTTTLTMIAGEVLTFRQKTTLGWAAESGNKPLSSLDTRFGSYGLAVGQGACVVPIGTHAGLYGQFQSNGTDTNVNYRVFIPLSDSTATTVLPVFANQSNFGVVGDDAPANSITISAACELSDGTVVPFSFNGAHQVTIGSGFAIPDTPINFGAQVTDSSTYVSGLTGVIIRTNVQVAAARVDTAGITSGSATVTDTSIQASDLGRKVTGTGIPSFAWVGTVTPGTSFLLSSKSGSQVNTNATATNASASITIGSYIPLAYSGFANAIKSNTTGDLTLDTSTAGSGGFGGSNANAYGPALLLGVQPKSGRKPIVASLTDSIFYGTSDQNIGPVARACAQYGFGHVKLSKVSEQAASYATPAGRKYRMSLVPGCTHAIIELGTNDGVDTVPKATTLQASLTTLINYLTGQGIKVYVATVPPKGVSSTNGYATTAGQTSNALPAAVSQINTWIRSLPLGISGVIELGDIVSSSRDSGLWAQSAQARTVSDAATTSGSNVVTSATANFTSADIGLAIYVPTVFTSYTSVIGSLNSSSSVNIVNASNVGLPALNAGATVTGSSLTVGSYYATQDGTHPSNRMMLGGILTAVQNAMSTFTL